MDVPHPHPFKFDRSLSLSLSDSCLEFGGLGLRHGNGEALGCVEPGDGDPEAGVLRVSSDLQPHRVP